MRTDMAIEADMVNLLAERNVNDANARPKVRRIRKDESLAEIPTLDDEVAKELVQLFKLFSDETRLRILFFLMHRNELNVRALCELLGQSQPAVSHHLALLRVAGLIDSRRDGKHNFYRLLTERLQQLIDTLNAASPAAAQRLRCGGAPPSDGELRTGTPVNGVADTHDETPC